uniref:Uncharacterized protein n=1 Tax=Arundo donax TaxID=35708 RepID=A0A0A9CG07_ARUDO
MYLKVLMDHQNSKNIHTTGRGNSRKHVKQRHRKNHWKSQWMSSFPNLYVSLLNTRFL